MLHKERRATEYKVKLVLLATDDSGKSTFVRQMQVIHQNGFSDSELMRFANLLKENCLSSMQNILRCEKVKVPKNRKELKKNVLESDDLLKVFNEIKLLWQEKNIKEAFEKRIEFHISIPSTSDYYFDNVEKFAQENFQPTPEDIFRAKLKTTRIYEVVFEINKIEVTLVDVGGPRSERRKWLHYFNDVTSVIFFAALDEYDMTLEEDCLTNRLEESLRLFREITASKFFGVDSWILFLNKCDLLETKIKKKPLNKFFTDFPEDKGSSLEESIKYLRAKYLLNFRGARLYPYVVCALDTSNCKRVFTAVCDTVINGALNVAGLCI